MLQNVTGAARSRRSPVAERGSGALPSDTYPSGRCKISPINELRRILTVAVAVILMTGLVGCGTRKPPSPLSADWAKTRNGHYIGNPLAGARPVPADFAPRDAIAVHIRLVGLERDPESVMEPLAAYARLLTTIEGDNPFLATAGVTQPARYGTGAQADAFVQSLSSGIAGRTIEISSFDAVVPVGVTAYQDLTMAEAGSGRAQRLRIAVYRPAPAAAAGTTQPSLQTLELALLVQTPRPLAMPSPTAANARTSAAAESTPTRETALISQPIEGASQSVALLVPFNVAQTQIRAIAAVIELSLPSEGDAYEATVKRMLADVKSAADQAAARRAALPPGTLDPVFLASVSDAMTYGENRRAAVVYFATQAGARLCDQTALVADDEFLNQLCVAIADQMGRREAWTRDQAGWLLDRLALETLARTSIKKKLSSELTGVLIGCAGEAGRSPAAMEQILDNLSTRKDFENRLVAENFIALEDSSPAARVRAYDWLKSHGHAPDGYDPLGDARQRSAAIEKAISQMNQAEVQQ